MERNSKSTKEIFWRLYSASVLAENPIKCVEAIGWLKCTKQYMPSLEGWIDETIDLLIAKLCLTIFEREN